MRWIMLAAALAAALTFGNVGDRIRSDDWGRQQQTPLDDEPGGMTLDLCVDGEAC